MNRRMAAVLAAMAIILSPGGVSAEPSGIRYKSEVRDALADSETPERWNASELTCDALGRPVKRTLPTSIDALTGQPGTPFTELSYDDYGQLEEVSDVYGNATTYSHDILGNPAYTKLPAVEDAKSGLTQQPVTIFSYDPAGRLARKVDLLGCAWTYEHDAAGRLTKATGPVDNPATDAAHRRPVWQKFYDPSGNLTQSIDPEGHSITNGFYPNNLLASITRPVTFTDASGTPSLVDVVEQYQRDAMGRVIRMIDGGNQATAFSHDGLGRPLTTTWDPDDSRDSTPMDRLNEPTRSATVSFAFRCQRRSLWNFHLWTGTNHLLSLRTQTP